MSSGRFKLFYKDRDVDYPCVGVHYQVVTDGLAILAAGQTDAQGETADFNSLPGASQYRLQVRKTGGGWTPPDVVEESQYAPQISLGPVTDNGKTVKNLRIKPYFKLRFQTHPGDKPMAGAKFTAYTLDDQGREAVALDFDKKKVVGSTDAKGETALVRCASTLVFKFELPGASVKVPSPRLKPLIEGQDVELYEVPFKTVRATTAAKPDHQANLAGKASLPVLISPSDQELIMVPQSDYDEFEEMSGRLEKVMEASHLAKLDLSRALEAQNEADIAAAEKALGIAEDKVKTELNKNFSKVADLKEVVTLETYNKGKGSAGSGIGLRRRYLKTDKYLQLKAKRINKTEYKLTIKSDKALGAAQQTKTIKSESLNLEELKKSFAKISTSIKSKKEWKGDPHVLNLLDLAGNEYSNSLLKSDTYEVEAEAQWLRLVGCAGASSEIDWSKKTAQIQGNLQGKLVLCEGKMTGRWAAPSLKGWMMSFAGEDLGAVRFVITCELYGFAGAKITATGTVGVTMSGGKQAIQAIRQDPADTYRKLIDPKTKLPKFEADGPYAKTPENLNGVKVEIDAFAGVEGGITPGGAMQWLPPEAKEFVSFAEISATLAANAGAGATAQLMIYMAGGKFRIRAAARLCWGLGAKGALEFTVNANKVLEFAKWVSYQLLNSGFKELVYFDKVAFGALSKLMLMCVGEGSPLAPRIEELTKNVNAAFDQYLEQIEQAKARQAMVDSLNRGPAWLTHATPETRGMLLYQLTRHGTPSHLRDIPGANLSEGTWLNPEIHYLPSHKQAVCKIMATVLTASCWDNVMQHMTAQGTKSARPSGKNEGDVLRFLNDGISLADLPSVFEALNETGPVAKPVSKEKGSGNKYLDTYLKYRAALREKFPKGYRIAALDSREFELYPLDEDAQHPRFGVIQTAGLGEAMAGDPGSSLV